MNVTYFVAYCLDGTVPFFAGESVIEVAMCINGCSTAITSELDVVHRHSQPTIIIFLKGSGIQS